MSGIIGVSPDMRSGVVGKYPAGHVVKTGYAQFTASGVSNSSESWTWKFSQDITFTPIFATSNILLIATATIYSGAPYGYWDFYKNASDVTATYNLSENLQGVHLRQGGLWETATFMFLDPVAENSTSEKTYSLTGKSEPSGTTYVGWGTHQPIHFLIQEIAT